MMGTDNMDTLMGSGLVQIHDRVEEYPYQWNIRKD